MTDKIDFKNNPKRSLFHVLNISFFVILSILVLLPIWKVFVDSIDSTATYGIKLIPEDISFIGYKIIFGNQSLYKPFLISVYTTVVGTFFGLLICTIGAYVLIQYEMPGRKLFSYLLLFTMIFSGGLVPTYLVMKDLNLLNSLWVVILPISLNVYNMILMRNFFEGIPSSLFEAANIDGCTPFQTFIKIVLPLSKPALASIGLFFGVQLWNEYTSFTIYISDPLLANFQVKLRSLIIESTTMPEATGAGVNAKVIQNAAVIVALLPFMFVYPFCQKYFVAGVNIGAVKE